MTLKASRKDCFSGSLFVEEHTPPSRTVSVGAGLRLVEAGLSGNDASRAGLAERYGRGETSHTVHVWWARRPHAAMRGLVFATLCKEESPRSKTLLDYLGASSQVSDERLAEARRMIHNQYGHDPKVLDMFGGGGTIPFESLNLGAETYSIDSNQLSVFIQKCNLVYPQHVNKRESISLIKSSGVRVLEELRSETSHLFPLREQRSVANSEKGVCNYLWTYSRECPNCGFQYLLSKRGWLSKKRGKRLAFRLLSGAHRQSFAIEEVSQSYECPTVWNGKGRIVGCPKCKKEDGPISISTCRDELVAVIRRGNGRGKQFLLAPAEAVPDEETLKAMESRVLSELGEALPLSEIPRWSGIANPSLYGISTHSDFLNSRQRVVLLCLIKLLRAEFERLSKVHSLDTARFVIGMLSSLIDQLVDWNCRLSMWIPQNEQVGRAFCGPGLSMLWDYAETDPVMYGPANLWSKLKRIVEGAQSMGRFVSEPSVFHAYAQSLPFEDGFFDAIVTDPPYYDNIFYSLLADFFFSWKRMLLRSVDPGLFAESTTDSTVELVASKFRSGSADKAHADYCAQLGLAIGEASRVLKQDGVFSLVYSHSSLNGWEAFVRAYRPSNLSISGVLPLRVERRQRPRAMKSAAINTCISFFARKITQPKQSSDLRELCDHFRETCFGHLATELENGRWHGDDIAIALFAQGVALLCNVCSVSDCAGIREALLVLEEIVQERCPKFAVQRRNSI